MRDPEELPDWLQEEGTKGPFSGRCVQMRDGFLWLHPYHLMCILGKIRGGYRSHKEHMKSPCLDPWKRSLVLLPRRCSTWWLDQERTAQVGGAYLSIHHTEQGLSRADRWSPREETKPRGSSCGGSTLQRKNLEPQGRTQNFSTQLRLATKV